MNRPLAIFDVDGTICDTLDVDDACYLASVSMVLNEPVAVSSWEEAAHVTDAGVTDWLWSKYRHRSPTTEEVLALVCAYEAALVRELQRAPQKFRATPGAPALISRLLGDSWGVGIATGGWRRLARLKLSAAGIPGDFLLASSDDSHDRLEIFRIAHNRLSKSLGLPHSGRTVLVGDGIWDLRVACALGWSFLGVGKAERAARLKAEGASAVVEDFASLSEVLDLLQTCSVPKVAAPYQEVC
ncbi:MAG TPA: HAD family hydrolase [Blastocatellia bacterium]|nr:HAD family hydrolase [Blastocatellia bacterium]